MAVGLVPVDDVFETHAHAYQRAVRRMPTQVRKTPSWPEVGPTLAFVAVFQHEHLGQLASFWPP
jgi:hypothetical protein